MIRPVRATAGVGLGLSVLFATAAPAVLAQEPAQPIVVMIRPVGADGLEGLALLTAAGAGTTIQVQVQAPPPGTSAVIHPGTCDLLDATPMGLLGDMGSGAMTTITLPLPLATLVDGAHSIVLHPGLDLATVLGCGEIPIVAGPIAAPTGTLGTPPAPERFAGTRYPFGITWSAPWERYEYQGSTTGEGFTLYNGTSTVTLEAFDLAAGDAMACLQAWEDGLLGAWRTGSIQALTPVADGAGAVIWAGDADRARGGYSWARPSEPDTTWAEVIDCRRLSEGSVLRISHIVPSGSFLAEVAAVEALLVGLEAGGASPPPTPGSSGLPTSAPATDAPPPTAAPSNPAAPTPEPATPAPVATRAPTPGPDCTGMGPWVDAAVSRVERLRAIGQRVERSQSVRDVYVKALRDAAQELSTIRDEQAADAPPPSLAKLQTDLDEMYAAYIDGYQILADAFQYEDRILLGQADAKGREAEAIARQIQADAREILTPCGIRLPT